MTSPLPSLALQVRDDPAAQAKTQSAAMIWDELRPVDVDTQKLEHLFESRAKDLISKVRAGTGWWRGQTGCLQVQKAKQH